MNPKEATPFDSYFICPTAGMPCRACSLWDRLRLLTGYLLFKTTDPAGPACLYEAAAPSSPSSGVVDFCVDDEAVFFTRFFRFYSSLALLSFVNDSFCWLAVVDSVVVFDCLPVEDAATLLRFVPTKATEAAYFSLAAFRLTISAKKA
mmetsp:Transcript_35132/g.46257  ORF Transcript_35132/g.46257 Transcript_35132/m.46257 type:complete len:148 (+) Transcript_35132:203-646(+)